MSVGSIPGPPSNGFHLGPLFVHAYGLAYVLAVLAAVAITARRWQAQAGGASSSTRSPCGGSPPA